MTSASRPWNRLEEVSRGIQQCRRGIPLTLPSHLVYTYSSVADEDQTDAACKIIEKLTLKGQGYVPDTYLNPGSWPFTLTEVYIVA